MHEIIEDLNWRYATKRYDPDKKIDPDDLSVIKESLRLVATSYGLQTMKFLFIETPELRKQLLEASYNQNQIVDASHLLVLCAFTNITADKIDSYARNIAKTRNQALQDIEGYTNYMKRTIEEMDNDKLKEWSIRQVYIALGQLLETCAHLKIDSTPMEGFKIPAYNRILGLEKENLTAVLVCTLGYRHPKDPNQFREKVRRPIDELFENR